jgi:hypothetical protein
MNRVILEPKTVKITPVNEMTNKGEMTNKDVAVCVGRLGHAVLLVT